MKKKNKKLRIGIAGGYVLLILGIVICGIVLFPISLNEPQFKITKEVCEKDTIGYDGRKGREVNISNDFIIENIAYFLDEKYICNYLFDNPEDYSIQKCRTKVKSRNQLNTIFYVEVWYTTHETIQKCTQEEVDEIEMELTKQELDRILYKIKNAQCVKISEDDKAICTHWRVFILKQDLTLEILEENCECVEGGKEYIGHYCINEDTIKEISENDDCWIEKDVDNSCRYHIDRVNVEDYIIKCYFGKEDCQKYKCGDYEISII